VFLNTEIVAAVVAAMIVETVATTDAMISCCSVACCNHSRHECMCTFVRNNNNNDNNNNNKSTQRAQTPRRLKCQPKVIWDYHLDFWINPDPGPDVFWIFLKMFWTHCLVGISHFAKLCRNEPVTV